MSEAACNPKSIRVSTDSDLKKAVLAELNWEPSVDVAHIGVKARVDVDNLSDDITHALHRSWFFYPETVSAR